AFNRTTTWKALVAAKAWVSHYPILRVIIHTNSSRGIHNAWHFYYALVLVFKAVCSGFGIALFTP
ncbi:hypothetical protein, partial [Vibrio vulnificus]|uniref:hypothetical protein n=1 Tax=Vibrio vulnificus TaxID=672 RepID=UPI0027BA0893